ncbi:MAG: FtsX-like permease family protein, partial [Planctomycetota bacterium]
SSGVLTRFLAVVASISLVVGGVGITNIMLVSVAERRTEIGVRMAVGARRVDILAQFLGEGILTALIAGFLGIALGVAVAVAIGWMWSRPITLSPTAAGVAVLASGGVGLLFGAWPSVQAGRLDPIRALRAE